MGSACGMWSHTQTVVVRPQCDRIPGSREMFVDRCRRTPLAVFVVRRFSLPLRLRSEVVRC
jgi:hypothetical protein